jgi:hypothetical protein
MTGETASTEEDHEPTGLRFWMYWFTSIGATLIFLLFVFFMMMVPGVLLSEKLWMLSIAAAALVVPLGFGLWRVNSTNAPFCIWPLGPIMGVVLILELMQCVASIFFLLIKRPL